MKKVVLLTLFVFLNFVAFAIDSDFDIIFKKYNFKIGENIFFEVLSPKEGFIGGKSSTSYEYIPTSENDYYKCFIKFTLSEIHKNASNFNTLRIVFKIQNLSSHEKSEYPFFCLDFSLENKKVITDCGYTYTPDQQILNHEPDLLFSNFLVGFNDRTIIDEIKTDNIILNYQNINLSAILSQKIVNSYYLVNENTKIGNRAISSYYDLSSGTISNSKGIPLVLLGTELQWWHPDSYYFSRMVRFNSKGYIQYICRHIEFYPSENKKELFKQ